MPSRPSLPTDSSKTVVLLFGMLVILTVFGIAVVIRMLLTGRPASLVEILLFGLLAADAAILLLAARGRTSRGLIGYLSVWVLGLVPYFGWVVVYGAGQGLAEVIKRRSANAALIAAVIWIAVVTLCLGVHLLVGSVLAPP